jgi:broad specificity phosphatase PhoE
MTVFWLIRHGQTDWNNEGRFQGTMDIPLNQNGINQANQFIKYLNGTHFNALYSSDLSRALQTAKIISGFINKEIIIDVRLRERNLGEWEGKLLKEVQEEYKKAWNDLQNDPTEYRPLRGESVADCAKRMWAAADEIARTNPGGTVMIVSHGLALATLICKARSVPLQKVYSCIPDNIDPVKINWIVDG